MRKRYSTRIKDHNTHRLNTLKNFWTEVYFQQNKHFKACKKCMIKVGYIST